MINFQLDDDIFINIYICISSDYGCARQYMPYLVTVVHILVTICQCLNCAKCIDVVCIPKCYKLITR